jgi:hypothetical protein
VLRRADTHLLPTDNGTIQRTALPCKCWLGSLLARGTHSLLLQPVLSTPLRR